MSKCLRCNTTLTPIQTPLFELLVLATFLLFLFFRVGVIVCACAFPFLMIHASFYLRLSMRLSDYKKKYIFQFSSLILFIFYLAICCECHLQISSRVPNALGQ